MSNLSKWNVLFQEEETSFLLRFLSLFFVTRNQKEFWRVIEFSARPRPLFTHMGDVKGKMEIESMFKLRFKKFEKCLNILDEELWTVVTLSISCFAQENCP